MDGACSGAKCEGRKVAWNFPFIIVLLLALFFASCGGDSVSSQDDSYSSTLQSSTGESSSSTVDVDKFSSSELKLSSADESSSSVAISSTSTSSSNSESESSSSTESQLSSSLLKENSSSSSSLNVVFGEMTDERDGRVYKTITIDGKATWMAENLNYAYLQPTSTLDSSSWCYKNEPDSCTKYGRLYIWSAVMDSAGLFSDDTKGCGYYADEEKWYECPISSNVRGICPEYWHVPTAEEFLEPLSLSNDKNLLYGRDPNRLILRNDGKYHGMGFDILLIGRYASFWFSTEYDDIGAHCAEFPLVSLSSDMDPRTVAKKNEAYSLRCVKDEVEE